MQPVMIMAGGTGGHVFPALAVAHELRESGASIVWVGTKKGVESNVVPSAGIELVTMKIQGLRGKGLLQYLKAPFILLYTLFEALKIVIKYKPCVLLGMGGFASGPCALVGVLLRKPLIIHEQNSIVGFTNRMLAPLCATMFTGFPVQHKARKIEFTGNPVRANLLTIARPEQRFAGRVGAKRLLVIGGSQGSAALNKYVPLAVKELSAAMMVEVWHQCGASNSQPVIKAYQEINQKIKVDEFIDDMNAAYSWADLIVCRSGALTLAEIATVGLGAVLVPFPYAVDDHQTENARSYVQAGAAHLLAESELSARKLADLLANLFGNAKQLLHMACSARKLSGVNAGKRVAQECMLLGGLATTAVDA